KSTRSFRENPLLRLLGVPLLEPLHATRRIDKLLRARKERMALRADADTHVFVRGPCLDDVAARAVNHRINVFRMYLGFHEILSGSRNIQELRSPRKPNLYSIFPHVLVARAS